MLCKVLAQSTGKPHTTWPMAPPFSLEQLATLGGQFDAIRPDWKEDDPCLWSRLTFDSTHAILGSCLGSWLTSPWPRCHVGPEIPPCHELNFAGHCFAQTQNSVQRTLSPRVACGPPESGCSDVCISSHPGWPGLSSRHDGLYPRPWLMGCGLSWLNTDIDPPLALPPAPTSPTIIMV